MTKNKAWTKEDIDFIRKNYNKLTNEEIAIKLKRTKMSVSEACRRYKIKKDRSSILKSKYKRGILIGPNKGKKLPYLTKRNLENNPMNNPETRRKCKKSIKEGFKKGRKVWNKGLKGRPRKKEILCLKEKIILGMGKQKRIMNLQKEILKE